MRILSLFNGAGMIRPALEYAKINVKYLHYCEIDKHANAVMKNNYPNDILISDDVTKFFPKEGDYDLIVAGFPCQQFSVANKNRKGLEGGSGVLFYEAKRIIDTVNPKYFILENVASMKKDIQKYISEKLDVEPIMIDASWFSAQRRKRLFWTNIPNVKQPEKETWSTEILADVLIGGTNTYNNFNNRLSVDKSATIGTGSGTLTGKQSQIVLNDDTNKVPEKYYLSPEQEAKVRWLKRNSSNVANIGDKKSQANRIYDTEGKSITLSSCGGGLCAKTGLYCEKHPAITTALGRQGSSSEFLSSCKKVAEAENKTRIRRLTPIECERLMGLSDNFTKLGNYEGNIKEIKDTNRYKLCGNGFHTKVVAYILKNIT